MTGEAICGARCYAKGNTTSTMLRHLASKHEAENEAVRSKMKPPAVKRKLEESNTDKAEEPMAKKVPSMFFGESDAALDKRVTEAIINFLADSGVAFSVVGRSSFIDLVKVANKRIKLKSPKTYMRLTKVRAEEIDQSIRDIIKTIRDHG